MILWALFLACGFLFIMDFIFHRHAEHPWEALWGFYAVFGFVSCVALVLVAKQMRKILMRQENYYGDNE